MNIDDKSKPIEKAVPIYTEAEVLKLLISCKNTFCGSELQDYHNDNEVIKWFKNLKK